jgi:class 3 adenylate cyclase/tetratricopeptide (TPR) repeat protein
VVERRVCSVLFCDLVGFTPVAEARDPEVVRELLSEYFGAARAVIGRYGGVVEKFIGDAVMAVWGAPVAAEGDAERAVRAGLEVVAAVAGLGERAGVAGLAARAGVVTGEVAVTLGAVGEGMVAGDAVNTAARVQAAAEPRTVLADGRTHRLAGAGVGFADAGEHALKGKAQPVRLWRATRVLAGVGGAQRIDGLEAPLTGRDGELRTVKELFHAAAERRVPRLVLVSGPAGVGKSRLGWEFEKYTDGLAGQVWWHRGRCLAYGQGVAFGALAEIVRQRLSIADDDAPEVVGGRLAARLAEFLTDPAERAYAGVRLGRLLGVGFGGGDGRPLPRGELFAGWRLFFERLAAVHPVVLVVEDAEHADAGLLDFLEHLADWVRDLPVFVLVFARPELAKRRPGLGTGRNRTTLTLGPLDAAAMDVLLEGLVPGMPAVARAQVAGHAQGVPLFAVETIRSLIDRDIVQPRGGVYRLVGQVGDLQVPEGLHALLAARLDALPPPVRRLAGGAAVLGTTFPPEALTAVSSQDEGSVRAGLAELVHREVLGVSADPLSPQRGDYRFSHQMLRQVAYNTMSRRDRKAGHLKVAAYLRASFPGDGEEVTDVLAGHYLAALEAVPEDPDVDHIRGQAIATLVRAAERVQRTGAPALAATSYANAAQLTHDHPANVPEPGPAEGMLWEHAARAATTNADWAAAVAHADRARDYYTQHGNTRAAARAQAIAGTALRRWDRLAEAREQLTAALAVLRAQPDASTAAALGDLATVEVAVGSPDADRITTEALSVGRAVGAGPGQRASLLMSRALYLTSSERKPEAVTCFREAAQLAEQAGDGTLLGNVLFNLADTLAATDPAAAADAARTAATHLRRTGDRHYLAYAVTNLAQALFMLGDWDAADEELSRAADADGLADVEYLTQYRGLLAALRGDTPTAGAMLAALPDTMRTSPNPYNQADVSLLEAFTAAARHQPQDALRHARATLAHAAAIGISADDLRWAWPLAARAACDLSDTAALGEVLALLDAYQPGQLAPMLRAERDLARARLTAGRDDPDAGAAFTAAIVGLRQLSTPYHLAHGLLDHAQHLQRLGNADAAAAAISEARDIAQRLRCQPLLDRAHTIQPAKPASLPRDDDSHQPAHPPAAPPRDRKHG